MIGPVFVDTNIFVYARDPRDPTKKSCAKEWLQLLWNDKRGRTSIHVLSEFYAVLTRKLKTVSRDDAWEDVQLFMAWNPQPIDAQMLARAYEVEHRFHLSWWDSLVVASAQAQACVLLLTEDLQDGANFGGVSVRNPFSLGVAEAVAAYGEVPKILSRYRGRGRPRKAAKRSTAAAG